MREANAAITSGEQRSYGHNGDTRPGEPHSGLAYKSSLVDLDAAKAGPVEKGLNVGGGTNELMSTATILQLAKRQADQEHILRVKEDELKSLQEQLEESDRTHELRNKAHDILKSEIAMLTRQKKREEVDLAYLKNVIVKYMETEEHERLLPVLTMLLQITPDEVSKVEEARRKRKSQFPLGPISIEGVTDLLRPPITPVTRSSADIGSASAFPGLSYKQSSPSTPSNAKQVDPTAGSQSVPPGVSAS